MNLIKRIFHFFFIEVITKSVLLCFVSTFVVYLLLSITPKAAKKEVPIRFQTSQPVDTTRNEPDFQSEYKSQYKSEIIDTTQSDYRHNNTELQETSKPESRNFPAFYIEWVKSILNGNLGRIMAGQRIAEEIKTRFMVTFTLSFTSLVPALFVSFIIGLFINKPYLNWSGNIIYLLASLPAFLLGYLLFGIFGSNLLIATLTLGLSSGIINEMSRIIGNAMEVELTKDYIETARAKGLKEASLPFPGTVGFHAFRSALVTIIPRISIVFTLIISGSMVVEQVFRLPGLSYMLIDGLADKDKGRILVVVLVAVILIRILSILANFFYLLLNPRYGQR